jgi:hypothetical protein
LQINILSSDTGIHVNIALSSLTIPARCSLENSGNYQDGRRVSNPILIYCRRRQPFDQISPDKAAQLMALR